MLRAFASLVALLCCCTTSPLSARQTDRPQAFRSTVNTVAVYATVKEPGGRLVTTLGKDNFQVLDNGKPAPVTTFESQRLPFGAVLLIDTSFSVLSEFTVIQAATHSFVDELGPSDRLRIGSFGREVGLSPILTSDKRILHRVIDEELWPGGGATPLWRATKLGMDSILQDRERKIVVVLGDGRDSGQDYNCAPLVLDPFGAIGPCPTKSDVRKGAVAGEVMFYGIGLAGTGLDPGLIDVIDDTGGGYLRLARNADLASTFRSVVEELHSQYLIGFEPTVLDGKTHKLEVKVTRPGFIVRARKSYVARERR